MARGEAGGEFPEAAGRVPPHDLEAERAVLSALLLDNLAFHQVADEVKAEDFYHPAHAQIYQGMLALQDENEPVDLHTLSDHLNQKKRLDAVGGGFSATGGATGASIDASSSLIIACNAGLSVAM